MRNNWISRLGNCFPARAALCAVAVGFAPTVFAAGDPADSQAEWAQRYDADARLTVVRSTTPILSTQTVAASEAAIAQYQEIVANGGWPSVPSSQPLRLGSSGAAVQSLRRRLIVSGDIGPETGASPVFDSYVEAAVRRFQERHGIIADRRSSTQQTFGAMNVLGGNAPAPARDQSRAPAQLFAAISAIVT